MKNPFSLMFGKSPSEYISRPLQSNTIIDTFTEDEPSQHIFVITGIRGSGKTVLMTSVAEKFREMEDWIVLDLNPELDILQATAAKLSSINYCAELFRAAKINLSFFGLGIEISGEPPIRDMETALTRMLSELKKHGKHVLLTIDEATNNVNMRIFAGSFQIFVRNELPVYLLMTGLYENIEQLQDEKNLTFLYRAPKIQLPALNLTAIGVKYEEVFKTDSATAQKMAALTCGYPFAFQVLGYLSWEHQTFDDRVKAEYRLYLEEYVYEKIWSEMSAKDRYVAYGIAKSKSGKIEEIRGDLGLSTNEFNPYRKRLVRKGVLNGETRGYVRFVLPLFADFILDNYAADV